MPLQKLPVTSLDDINHRRRARETLNQVLDHSFDDSRRQTTAEKLAGITPVNYAYAPPDIRRYGADVTGIADSTKAIRDALSANRYAYIPPGLFTVSSTIVLTGATAIVNGEACGGRAGLVSRINFTGTGALFSATGAEFGSVYIGHLSIDGGSGDGVACILSERPQSVYEWLEIGAGSAGYDNPGIRLNPGASFDRSWDTAIRHCKWVGPTSGQPHQQNTYRGYYIEIGGGFCDFQDNEAILGSVGLEIWQGQAIRVSRFITNRQNSTYSSESAAVGQAGIRLSGSPSVNSRYKPACSIINSYIEANTNGVYVESCESLTIADNYFADVGEGSSPGITIANGDAQNVTIRNNQILQQNSGATAILNASSNKVLITSNNIDCYGGGGAKWLSTSVRCDYGYNRIIAGVLDDTNNLSVEIEPQEGSWTPTIAGVGTAGTQTYAVQEARWKSFARKVEFWGAIVMTAKDAATASNLVIRGLPFTSRNNTSRLYTGSVSSFSNLDLTAGYTQVGIVVADNSSDIGLYQSGDGAAVAVAAVGAASLQATSAIYFSGTMEI